MQEPDGGGDAVDRVHHRRFQRGKPRVIGEMSLSNGRGVIQNHTAVLKQALDNVLRMLGTMKMFRRLDDASVRSCKGNIIPRIDVDFLQFISPKIRRQYGILRHFPIQPFRQFLRRHPLDLKVTIPHKLLDIGAELGQLFLVGQYGCVFPRNMFLRHG